MTQTKNQSYKAKNYNEKLQQYQKLNIEQWQSLNFLGHLIKTPANPSFNM